MASPHAFASRVSTHPNPFLFASAPRFEDAAAAAPPLAANLNAPPAESVEVTVLWGTTVLSTSQLSPPRSYAVGEVAGAGGAGLAPSEKVDFALAAEYLGSARRELVTMRDGTPLVVFAAGETPRVFEGGQPVDASNVTLDCAELAPGVHGIALCLGRVVVVETGGIQFRLAGCEKPETVPRAILGSTDKSSLTALGTATVLQGVLIASLAYFTPSLALADDEDLERDRLVLMQQYLHAQAERNKEQEEQKLADAATGQTGAPAAGTPGPEGKSGRPNAPAQQRRMGIQGQHAERVVGRQEQMAEASTFGMISTLTALNASNAPSSPWGAELALGPDAENGTGDLWGEHIGDVAGTGLGLSGTGIGSGGIGVGIGMGQIGTCMGLNCYGNGKDGFGGSLARLAPTHKTQVPRIRPAGETITSGRLPAEVVQRIVRQNFGRFRACYDIGLRSNPNLEGRVTARFVIGRDGAVSNVSAGGDLPNAQVTSCIGSAFYGLSFPAPDGGVVTVSYPIMLTPG